MTQPQLSRVENGPPIKDLDKLVLWARTLRIPGHLLWFSLPEHAVGVGTVATSRMPLDPDERDRLIRVATNPRQVDTAALNSFAILLHESRRLEDEIGAAPLLGSACAQLVLLKDLVVEAHGPLHRQVVGLASQYAQFVGLLHDSAGQPSEAHAYYDRAMEWGLEADDPDMVATVLSMKGTIA